MQNLDVPSLDRRRFLLASAGLFGLAITGRLAAQQPLPARRPADTPDGPPIVTARAWAVFDAATGRRLHGGNDAAALPMASTTKIMTAWVVLQHAVNNPKVLDEIVNVSAEAARTPGSSARLQAGDRIPVREILYGLLLPSGNNAAQALAEHFGPRLGDPKTKTPAVAAFLAEMNRQAARLKLGETRYIDPHGLGRNLTSARDLCTLGFTAMQNATFRQYVQTRRHRTQITNGKNERRKITWQNTNKLLDIEGYNGIKTGTTTAAGSCLVASGQRGQSRLIVTILGCTSNDSRYADTRNLFRWAWRQK